MSQKEQYIGEKTGRTGTSPGQIVGKVLNYGERAWRVFTYSCLYVAVLAMVESGIAMILLGLQPNPAPAVIGLITFAVYANDRIVDVDTDALTNPQKADFIRRHTGVLYPLAAVAYGLAVSVAVLGGPVALSLTLLPGTFWVFYASNWFDTIAGKISRIKELLIVNTAVVATAWAVTLTFLPFAFAGQRVTVGALVVFAYLFLRVFVLAEVSNISDRDGDKQIGVDTIPVVYGIDGTRHTLYLVNLLTATLLAVAIVNTVFSLSFILALAAGTSYSLAAIALIGRWENVPALAHVVEGEHFVTYLLLLAALSLS